MHSSLHNQHLPSSTTCDVKTSDLLELSERHASPSGTQATLSRDHQEQFRKSNHFRCFNSRASATEVRFAACLGRTCRTELTRFDSWSRDEGMSPNDPTSCVVASNRSTDCHLLLHNHMTPICQGTECINILKLWIDRS